MFVFINSRNPCQKKYLYTYQSKAQTKENFGVEVTPDRKKNKSVCIFFIKKLMEKFIENKWEKWIGKNDFEKFLLRKMKKEIKKMLKNLKEKKMQ
ncbi:hypothetical protein RFI_39991 [Reticulomyxa filosa]|uniref:Uncharacterized protein n=1 Tax=Reticulomyxa filosa TaxID=46433 RepID=X6L823_RETFI|nr:hypothetical protein RFI_39991 [Reticulomyxa filosa]|eukprot:ETN97538.1 hypothetical protein RFI_39991 [Reticulomyxa filosa]